MMQNQQNLVRYAVRGLIFLLTCFTLPVAALFNRRFGERYLSLPRIAVALTVIPWLSDLTLPRPEDAASLIAYRTHHTVLMLFAIVMLWHWLETRERVRRGGQWHSRSQGVPWPFLGPDGKWQRIGLQPALCMALGAISLWWSESLGQYFLVTSVLLAIGAAMQYAALRSRLLDLQDAVLEQQAWAKLMEPTPEPPSIEETNGLPIQEVITPAERKNAPSLAEIMAEVRRGGLGQVFTR